jgi:hypothetical protein
MRRFVIRDLLWLTLVVAVALGWWLSGRNGERNATRQRILETGTVTEYDYQLLGDEVNSLQDEYVRRVTKRRPSQETNSN